MAFPYRHVLLIGATSGIGKGMADRFIEAGVKVTVVGRRKERLEEFVSRHGESKAGAMPFDIGNRDQIPQFASDAMRACPDIDCVFLNAGIQSRHDFSKPEKVDLAMFHSEMNINFSSFVDLTHAFLPFLLNKESDTSLIYTGSNIAIVPASILPAYSASKTALNVFVLCLRDQLRATKVKVIELSPPPVQTEIHDVTMGEEAGRKFGMPLDVFAEKAYEELVTGKDQIVIGSIGPAETFNEIVDKRRASFDALCKFMRGES
ncbi:oxidoreductase [Glonium stellatum]|uniref:Oxidoreductase n=1 Tax=Glonium stellatum TaxID=574774 RepID=A0A8E2EM67_9PEZI|nr:oxidoreductase [Glonium stellatum]